MALNVLPIIDLQTGQVQFPLRGVWVSYYVTDPHLLTRLLARTVGPPSFDSQREELSVFVAVRGQNAGTAHVFSLAKFPVLESLTKLGG
ncbi:hypothetical protein CQ010_11310 [Arthrobacter sp. MYb211]|uniref:hypothetical protein n=1 Tax=unclassified Arthrobacter TaxID=235627 RepID=UPI000CFAB5CF|nr:MULTISPECIES: hypothetical protein [unclassified Arthrobacter]PQZ97372.1 hypothetical protein CQ017_14055 [Arthrobacter sp. MYb224]PRA00839.1 hypothetical protein CQ019_14985 [Arthrobacter sp. MYb229]PRA10787.1 hypothetical protein CQ015_12025 [Arthrobacter sp. MYb221]PRB48773.1 hypothetical protein CQ013_14390 [Arthrobacter sp. MYb216]PRC06845.1 hypothetical protein CQ010_11310 [Arthrobacter sp. MYb211]